MHRTQKCGTELPIMLLGVFLVESVTVTSEFTIGFLQQKISFFIKSLRLRHPQAKTQMFFRYAHKPPQLHFILPKQTPALQETNVTVTVPSAPFPLPKMAMERALSALSYDGYHNIFTDFLPGKRMDTAGSCCPYLTWLRGTLPGSAV